MECWEEKFQLSEPYTIAYETISSTTNVFLKLETDQGIIGWGCAAPDWEVTGENGETVIKAFNSIIEPVLNQADPFTYARILEDIRQPLKHQPSAMAMVDMALYDLMAKKAEEPVYKLLGGYRHSIPTSITIGILSVEDTLEKAREFWSKGFRIIKVKGGAEVAADVERVTKMREEFGKTLELRFDANQGYSVEDSLEFLAKTKNVGIELLEQPTLMGNDDLLRQVSQKASIPVMADESLKTLKDVFHLTSNDCTDMINIKLMKVGGIAEAARINAVALAAKVESMIGCMDESGMGIAAGLHFALSRPNILYADLDGHFDLINDPYHQMVRCENGILYPSEKPGFGF